MLKETKDHLKRLAAVKRGVLLKDCTPELLGIALDFVQESTALAAPDKLNGAYFKYAPAWFVTECAARLPHISLTIPRGWVGGSPTDHRPMVVFHVDAVESLLKFLVSKPATYWNRFRYEITPVLLEMMAREVKNS